MTSQTVIKRILLITEIFDKQYESKETGIKKIQISSLRVS